MPDKVVAKAPGRVNLLGEHVDYNGGVVLPIAIDRAVEVTAQKREDSIVFLRAIDLHEEVVFDLNNLDTKCDCNGAPLPSWSYYPAGVAWVLRQHGFALAGLDAQFTSTVPIGAGLSSSAAVEVSFAVLWQALGGWQVDSMRLAQYCQEAENRYVGLNCGLMDQFASMHGVEGHALYFDTRSLEYRPVPLPANTAVVIADSGVRHSLAGNSAYNNRRAACEEALRILQSQIPNISALRDVHPDDFNLHAHLLPAEIGRRARHVVEECARVEQAAASLSAGDVHHFGRLMFAGHASLRDLYEVSCQELDALVEIAATLEGCYGARLTGAGFGGCTANLVDDACAQPFMEQLSEGYHQKTGHMAEVYLCHASPGARVRIS